MTLEIESQRESRGGNFRRILLIAVGCVLWVGLVVGAVAFQWSKISQMRQMPRTDALGAVGATVRFILPHAAAAAESPDARRAGGQGARG